MSHIVVTYCSRKKNRPDVVMMSAFTRYAGKHIAAAHQFAMEQKRELYFLSGLYGLIHSATPITYYDMYLSHVDVPLIQKVTKQINDAHIVDIWYLTEGTAAVSAYDELLRRAVATHNVSPRKPPQTRLFERDFNNLEGL